MEFLQSLWLFFLGLASFLLLDVVGNPLRKYVVVFCVGAVIFYCYLLIHHWAVYTSTRLVGSSVDKYIHIFATMILHIPRIVIFFLFLFWVAVFLDLALTFLSLRLFVSVLLVLCAFWLSRYTKDILEYVFQFFLENDSHDETMLVALNLFCTIFLWIVVIFLLVLLRGGQITPLFASLGLGSIVIAFALQNILRDFFSSFTLFFDKPFRVGDLIRIGTDIGTVQHISLKSTRIKTLSGQMLVMPNSEMLIARIENFSGLEKRRVMHKFLIAEIDDAAVLSWIADVSERILHDDACEFLWMKMHDISLQGYITELVYYTIADTYELHMDKKQEIFLYTCAVAQSHHISFRFSSIGSDLGVL